MDAATDVIYLALIALLFGLSWALVRLCEALGNDAGGSDR